MFNNLMFNNLMFNNLMFNNLMFNNLMFNNLMFNNLIFNNLIFFLFILTFILSRYLLEIENRKKMHTKKTTNKYTNKNTFASRNICKTSSNFLKKNTKPITYKQYISHIKNITTHFTKTQFKLLNDIYNTKNTTKFNITINKTKLDKYNSIPPFIDIFRYLIYDTDFINKFTLDEQKLLKQYLDLKYSHNKCYNYLDKSKLGNKILSFYNDISHNIKSEIIKKYPSIEFHSLLINSFTSFEIIKDLDLKIKKLVKFNLEWNGRKIDNFLYMFMYNDEKIYEDNIKLKNLGNEITKRILFFNEFLNNDKIPNKFILFLTDNLKEIDDTVLSHMHFNTINVNSAVTNSIDIIIYRKEELLKSIFHELIHFHNLDFRNIPSEIITYLIKTHNIKSDNNYLLYECVTEAMANILNNIFISKNIKEFTNNLQHEILFSTLQIAKILNICNFNYWDEFARLDNNDIYRKTYNNSNPKKHFKQESCVMSYYILKFYILMNLDTYFKKCLDTKLKFIQTSENFNNLIKIFDASRTNIFIKNIIDNLLDKLKINRKKGKMDYKKDGTKLTIKKIDLDKKINKSLRMTCLNSNFI